MNNLVSNLDWKLEIFSIFFKISSLNNKNPVIIVKYYTQYWRKNFIVK